MTNPKPIIVPDFEDVYDRLFENGELSPNSECIRFLRECIDSKGGFWAKRGTFEVFSERLNNHPDRELLISEMVGVGIITTTNRPKMSISGV
jgi:hypothetical protein